MLFAVFNGFFIDKWITIIHYVFKIIIEAIGNNHQFIRVVQKSYDLTFYSFFRWREVYEQL